MGKKLAKIIFPDTNFGMKSQKLLEKLLKIISRKIKRQTYKSNVTFLNRHINGQRGWKTATNTRSDKY